MASLGRADQQDLLQWADTVGARADLPRLIRRLILETGIGVIQLGFPAGAGTSAGSWDGTARASQATAFIPHDLSLWELSVEKKVESKANSDFAKRTTTPDGSPTADCTYVQVGLRRWAKRRDWANSKGSVKRWKDVRAYGVDDIETWLDAAPVTHAWFSALLGLAPYGVVAAETWWEDWSRATSPGLTSAFVLAGREAQATILRDRLRGAPVVTTIGGQSEEDVLAFVAAIAKAEAAADGGYIFARCALIDDVESWRALRDRAGPLILVPRGEDVRREVTVGLTHHVLVPVPGSEQADITLPAIESAPATTALRDAGMPEDAANDVGRLARLSLIAARRRLAIKPSLHEPGWAQAPVEHTTRAVLLAGRWSARHPADTKIVAELAAAEYEQVRDAVEGLAAEGDPFVARVDQSIGVVSVVDAWILLRRHLRKEDLERFGMAVNQVLLEVNPALELPPDDRWRAGVLGKIRDFSGDLRRGLATSLALLGVHGDAIGPPGGTTGADTAKLLVRGLLEQGNRDRTCEVWASLEDILPLLAESAPDEFLDAVRAGTVGTEPLLAGMFTDHEGSAFSAHSPHTGLLWALERLAWSSDYFGQAVALLARLAEIDPGGSWTNRPANSLVSILCPWHPDTSASSAARIEAIDGLRSRSPAVAWTLMLGLLPHPVQSVHHPTADPHYRDWKPAKIEVLNVEYWGFIDDTTTRLIEDAGLDPARWNELIALLPSLTPAGRSQAIAALDGVANAGTMAAADGMKLWEALGVQLRRHRHFADAPWALPQADLDSLDDIWRQLQPAQPEVRHAWLFSEHTPDLGGPEERNNYAEQVTRVAEARKDAAIEIDRAIGLDGLLRFADSVSQPWALGVAMAEAGIGDEAAILALLPEEPSPQQSLAWAYVARRFELEGWEWLDGVLSTALPPVAAARLLLATRDFPAGWEKALILGHDVESAFWRDFSTVGLGADFTHLSFAAEKLLTVGRAGAALELISHYLREDAAESHDLAELIGRALDQLLSAPSEQEVRRLSQYEFQQLFNYLQRCRDYLGVERVGRLEWAYLPALGYDAAPQTLHRLMAADPGFFVEIVSAIFRRRSQDVEADEPDEADSGRGINAYRLLSRWHIAPGLGDDGAIDSDVLRSWIAAVQKELSEVDRLEIGQQYIGQALASVPADPDGSWPSLVVREQIEELQSEHVESGFIVATLNKRGVTSRGLEDGGQQESAFVNRYKSTASKFANQWPRTASMLRKLAESYASDARRAEGSAERFRTGFEF